MGQINTPCKIATETGVLGENNSRCISREDANMTSSCPLCGVRALARIREDVLSDSLEHTCGKLMQSWLGLLIRCSVEPWFLAELTQSGQSSVAELEVVQARIVGAAMFCEPYIVDQKRHSMNKLNLFFFSSVNVHSFGRYDLAYPNALCNLHGATNTS